MTQDSQKVCCRPRFEDRPLLSEQTAVELEALFKILGNRSRLRMLHAIVRAQELCVGNLAQQVGMKPQAVSNQLQRLVDRRIVAYRREGNNIMYRIVDPCVRMLLDVGLCILEDWLSGALTDSAPEAFVTLDVRENV